MRFGSQVDGDIFRFTPVSTFAHFCPDVLKGKGLWVGKSFSFCFDSSKTMLNALSAC